MLHKNFRNILAKGSPNDRFVHQRSKEADCYYYIFLTLGSHIEN